MDDTPSRCSPPSNSNRPDDVCVRAALAGGAAYWSPWGGTAGRTAQAQRAARRVGRLRAPRDAWPVPPRRSASVGTACPTTRGSSTRVRAAQTPTAVRLPCGRNQHGAPRGGLERAAVPHRREVGRTRSTAGRGLRILGTSIVAVLLLSLAFRKPHEVEDRPSLPIPSVPSLSTQRFSGPRPSSNPSRFLRRSRSSNPVRHWSCPS